ncbi:cytochrome c [Paraflavitalea sp. CAU 1676]|uniref:c-type cytochrome n=1 Tax=Paraflavitalea sp. CAU 1676 TaxID=3032598 RepID=UPI0023DBC804|nr:cytochrome c [Paraflavitalea sp. CAU 1676]MDF2190907.1 cytochrome c [Paraflavitalea sp. CAU 1676]
MKKLSIIVVLVALVAWSCGDTRRSPGKVYMPDMAYSRAIETYTSLDTLHAQGINYNAMPVPGTVKRGELLPFPIAQDKQGELVNYELSKQVANPLPKMSETQSKEAERLYLVNCGICHGAGLDGKGVLHTRTDGSEGPYAAAPANLVGNPTYVNMPAGQMFYSVTYGKGQMGSYASQLSTTQRWMVIQYIKAKQAGAGGAAAPAAADSAAAKPAVDTTAKK